MKHLAQKDSRKKYIYFDLEATTWSTVVCAVAQDESGITLVAHSVVELIDRARDLGWLTRKYTWLAHYGGIYDLLVVIQDLLPEWTIYSGIHGSGAGTWKLEMRSGKETLNLCDSARLIPGGLRGWGDKIGAPKGDLDRTKIGSYPWATIVEYCTRDVEILRLIHARCREFWKMMFPGTEPAATLPSTIARVIRREFIPADAWNWDAKIDEIVAQAYYGGRTERFSQILARGVEHDINGSYAAAMCGNLPTRYRGITRRLRENACDIVHATVMVPRDCHIPVLPLRCDSGALSGKLVFPVGQITGWWAGEELRYAISQRAASIEKLHAVYEYDSEPFLGAFMERVYEFRRKSDALDSTFAKLAQNSAYGKFIQRSEYSTLTQDHAQISRNLDELQQAYDEKRHAPFPMPRIFHVEAHNEKLDIVEIFKNVTPGLRHAAAAAHITARGRIALHRGLVGSTSAVYCDTDSVHSALGVPQKYCHDTELGKFKLVGEVVNGRYLAPKLYAYDRKGAFVVHAKGLRLNRRDGEILDDYQDRIAETWQKLVDFQPIEYESTRMFKRALMQGSVEFKRVKMVWQRKKGIDKRCIEGQKSRPWHVKELPMLKDPTE